VTNWFVAVGGDDTNSGLSSTDAFQHVAQGVSQLQAGDTLFIGGRHLYRARDDRRAGSLSSPYQVNTQS
jgi:hypothetical protein